MPPRLLDDDEEAVAVAIGLRTAVGGKVLARALTKLEQVLPSRLRHCVDALRASTEPVPSNCPGPVVDATVLSTLATA